MALQALRPGPMAPGRSILELGVGSASLSIPKSDQIMNEPFTSFYFLSFLIFFDDEPLGILIQAVYPGRAGALGGNPYTFESHPQIAKCPRFAQMMFKFLSECHFELNSDSIKHLAGTAKPF